MNTFFDLSHIQNPMRVQSAIHDVGTLGHIAIAHIVRMCLLGRNFTWSPNPSPDQVKKGKTPVVLIHGNGSHEAQWLLAHKYLVKPEIGSVHSFNIDGFFTNQFHKGIDDYAKEVLSPFINKVCEEAGVKKVILVGHSMGGLVGADYLVNWAKVNGIAVEMLITISTPWTTSPTHTWVSTFLSSFRDPKRCRQMLNENGFLDNLKEKISLIRDTLIHSIYSTVDNLVPGESGKLDLESVTFKEFHDEGHYTVSKSRPVWEHIADLISSLAKSILERKST